MEIKSFLLPKEDVSYLPTSASMKEALELLDACHYSAIPIIDEQGKYIGTLSEGDLLWKMRDDANVTFETMHQVPVTAIKKRIRNESVAINANFDDMLALAADQNFVPVVDQNVVFLGIIRRKDIIEYYTRNITD
jgi:CBS-domain-containing membrane protein